MIWRIMDTYNLVKDIEGPFTSSVVYEKMSALGMSHDDIHPRYCKHLKKLAKQGYLTRTGGKKGQTGRAIYIYEVIKNE